jgi:hypothetical protein
VEKMAARGVLLELLAVARKWQAAALPTRKAGGDYDAIRSEYEGRLFDAFMSYIQSGSRAQRSAAGRAVVEAVPAAFERGIEDGGGDTDDIDPEDSAWATAQQGTQIDYLDGVFEWLKDLRANDTATEDMIQGRVNMWVGTLDGIYSEGRLRGMKNQKLYFDGDDGKESCVDCQRLKNGPPRTAKWVREHDMAPHPGNTNFECGGWNCAHAWYSVKTDEQVTF